jgi:hypothetical protein
MLINKILSAYMPPEIIMSAWPQRSAHLSRILSIQPYKSHLKQASDHMILRFGSKTDAFMLHMSKYYKQGH